MPQITLGLWHNFRGIDNFEKADSIAIASFDRGITHFDLANNYRPILCSAGKNFAKIFINNVQGNFRDEIGISNKAGWTISNGPLGDWGSRKILLSSLDQSLKRMDF